MEILEKQDLQDFEKRIMGYMELITSSPMKEWFGIDDIAKLRGCSLDFMNQNTELQPNFGVPEDRWGKKLLWRRNTVHVWLQKSYRELVAIWDSYSVAERKRILQDREDMKSAHTKKAS